MGLIPDSTLILIYYTFIGMGLIGYLGSKLFKFFPFKYIPFFGQYPLLTELSGVVLLCLGLFLYGGHATEMAWRDRVKKVEEQLKDAEDKSKKVNTVIKTKIVKQKEVIHDTKVVIQETIKEVEKRIDADCKLDPVIPKILNDAAKNPLGDTR